MSDITVIGLGLMGSALVLAIQRADHGSTVRSRSSAKMHPCKVTRRALSIRKTLDCGR